MNMPWLKSMIFWIVLILIILFIFKCSQQSEANKAAPTLMYERLYQCTQQPPIQSQQALIQQIQNSVTTEMPQSELMQLLNACRKANPLKSKQDYVNAIKMLK